MLALADCAMVVVFDEPSPILLMIRSHFFVLPAAKAALALVSWAMALFCSLPDIAAMSVSSLAREALSQVMLSACALGNARARNGTMRTAAFFISTTLL